jgi:glycosyltransferase involved in cell wall biosynthesis
MRLSLPAFLQQRQTASHRPVHVCFVIDRLSRAGTETQLLALIRNLDRDRVRPHLCLLNGEDAESTSLRPQDCPTLLLGLNKLIGVGSLPAAARLAAFWRRHRTDVVQTYFKDSTYFAAPLARLCGIRKVVRVRNNVGYWLTPSHRLLGRIIGRLTTTLTNSEDARQSVVQSERLAPRRVQVLENGVDVERFQHTPLPDTSQAVVKVGAVANLRPVKNIDGLIRVAANICRNDGRVEFHIAGEGNERARLNAQIGTAGLAGRFVLHGSVVDVPKFLTSLDVAVLCSHSESMSNALLEYMAAGRAIVATDVGSNARVARDEQEALIVPPRDDRAVEIAITRYLRDPPLARRFGEAARMRAQSEFSREAMVRRFEEFFTTLVK